jgi:methyl-accepting chemotaxis protein
LKKIAYNLKLQWRMTILVSLTGLVIMAAVSLVSYFTAANIVRARIRSELVAQSQSIANELDTYFDRIAEIPTLTAQVDATMLGESGYADQVWAYTLPILKNDPDIQDIYSGYEKGVVDGKDYVLMTWKYDSADRKNIIKGSYNFPGDPNYDSSKDLYEYHTDESWYVLAQKAGKTVWGTPYYDAGGANAVITSAVSPIIKDGKFMGVAGVDVPLTKLNEIVSQFKIGKTGYASVLDSTTRYVANPNHPDYVENGTSLAEIAKSSGASTANEIVNNMLAGKASYTEGYSPVAKAYHMTFYTQIKSTGWWVLVTVPTNEMMGDVNRIAFASAVIAVLGIMLLWVVTALISRSIVSPLKVLAHGAWRLSQGIITVDQKDAKSYQQLLERGDELGEVGRSFKDLIEYFAGMAAAAHGIAHGDLTQKINPKCSEDSLGNAFSEMIAGLRELVGGVTEKSVTLQESAEMMAASSEQSGQATTQIAATIQQVAKGIGQQSESITATAASVSEMSRAIDGVSKGAQDQAEAVTRAFHGHDSAFERYPRGHG